MAYVAGDSALIPIIVAGVLALLAYGFFGELNGMFPTAAAIRLYMKRAMDDRAALTITFTYMTTIILVIASDAFIVGSALAHAFGEPAWVPRSGSSDCSGSPCVTNLRGITGRRPPPGHGHLRRRGGDARRGGAGPGPQRARPAHPLPAAARAQPAETSSRRWRSVSSSTAHSSG